mmetsp:Transcript_19684/g.61947  ORF Transcript_19684/g.61947 Transcript_19684/m.61947 type:complete len:223 (-) Transcript_19684:3-671(-)
MPRCRHFAASSRGASASSIAAPRFAQASHRESSARTTSRYSSAASRSRPCRSRTVAAAAAFDCSRLARLWAASTWKYAAPVASAAAGHVPDAALASACRYSSSARAASFDRSSATDAKFTAQSHAHGNSPSPTHLAYAVDARSSSPRRYAPFPAVSSRSLSHGAGARSSAVVHASLTSHRRPPTAPPRATSPHVSTPHHAANTTAATSIPSSGTAFFSSHLS